MPWHGTIRSGTSGAAAGAPGPLPRRRGSARFTLVELLMVLAIVSILAGLILPATSKMRERARLADCLGLVRQFGIAVSGYANDNVD